MLILILLFFFMSAALIGIVVVPFLTKKFHRVQRKKISETSSQLEELFVIIPASKLLLLYTITPLTLGIIAFLLFKSGFALLGGMFLGFFFPQLMIKNMEAKRRKKLQGQLVDALMTLSSSFKGGLSLLQAMEVLVEEMPPPISQEFSLVIRENKVGVPLDESLIKLNKRVNLEEMELMINSILVARETGGDLTKVFYRLAEALRDRRKLKEHITTLTLQGKIQGAVMSLLPVVFVIWVYSFNKHHFDIMFESDLGRMLLIAAIVLQVVGTFLIIMFSKIEM